MRMQMLLAFSLLAAGLGQASAQSHTMSGMDTRSKPAVSNPATRAYMRAMMAMHESMRSMTPANDADKDFVTMMIPHHQAAVDMAQTYLKYGTDPQLKQMAQDIVSSQTAEIGTMKTWQAGHGR